MPKYYQPSKEEVRRLRKDLDITQQECADMCLLQANTWSRYEQGVVQMPAYVWELFRLKTKMHMIINKGKA